MLFISDFIFEQVASQSYKVFAVLTYHKLKQGKTLGYAKALQRKWKVNLHAGRKEAGLISDWGMYTYYPYGFVRPLKSDHDYFTAYFGFDLEKMNEFPQILVDQVLAKEPGSFNFEKSDDIVRG
ncbi:MAG: hypothetical protein ACOVRG_12070 [Saprospiraceae bacterium]